jgi:hypothetical protein
MRSSVSRLNPRFFAYPTDKGRLSGARPPSPQPRAPPGQVVVQELPGSQTNSTTPFHTDVNYEQVGWHCCNGPR